MNQTKDKSVIQFPPPNLDAKDPLWHDTLAAWDEIAGLLEQPTFQERYSMGSIAMALIFAGYKAFSVAIEDPAFLGAEAIDRVQQGEPKSTAYERAAGGLGSLLEDSETETSESED